MEMNAAMQAKLDQMKQKWDEGRDTPPGPPDGVYEFQLQSADMRASSKGTLITMWEFLVIGGDYAGNVCRDMISVEMESGPYRIGQRLKKLGLEIPDDIHALPEVFDLLTATNPIVRARLRHSGDFINVNIQELLDSSPGGVVPAPTGVDVDDGGPTPSSPFGVGMLVSITHEGRVLSGPITTIDRKAGVCSFSDEDNLYEEVRLEDLTIVTDVPPTPEEAAAPVAKAPPPKKVNASTTDDTEALLHFAIANGLEGPGLDSTATREHLIEVISGYAWTTDRLEPNELALLGGAGIEVGPPTDSA